MYAKIEVDKLHFLHFFGQYLCKITVDYCIVESYLMHLDSCVGG